MIRRIDNLLRRRWPAYSDWRSGYARTLRRLHVTETNDPGRIAEQQLAELNSLLRHAVATVPAHARKFAAAGVRLPLRSLSELPALPLMTKHDLRSTPAEFVSCSCPSPAQRTVTSGGTTGEPTPFQAHAGTYDGTFRAWCHFLWSHAGFNAGAPTLDLTWAFTGGGPLREWRERHRTYLSINELTPERAPAWREAVLQLQPEFIVAFPSTAGMLAQLMPAAAFPQLRAVILGSEALGATQRHLLQKVFPGARLFPWYGMAELAGFASGCERSDTLHHWPQSGVLELLGDDGHLVTQPGSSGEIVLTGFAQRVTPFIRYRTGDSATLGAACPDCGRPHLTLASLDGRLGDFLLGRNGHRIPLSALNFHSSEFDRVFAHQFVQDEPGHVRLLLVPRSGFGPTDELAIRRLFEPRLGGSALVIERVADIPRTPRGKRPLILQRCPSGAADLPSP